MASFPKALASKCGRSIRVRSRIAPVPFEMRPHLPSRSCPLAKLEFQRQEPWNASAGNRRQLAPSPEKFGLHLDLQKPSVEWIRECLGRRIGPAIHGIDPQHAAEAARRSPGPNAAGCALRRLLLDEGSTAQAETVFRDRH